MRLQYSRADFELRIVDFGLRMRLENSRANLNPPNPP
jgi:hypothetical protein